MPHTNNRILQSLPASELNVVGPLLKSRHLAQHDVLFDIRNTVQTVHFPFNAAISLVVPLSSGELIETAMVGHDGVLGGSAVINGRVSLNRAIVQLDGHCSSCDVDALGRVLPQCPALHDLLLRHQQVLFAQAQQSAACNVTHPVSSRLARWLLRARDLADRDELELTQEYMAEMLGVRRTTVTLTAHTLQEAGLIRYRRGRITIMNVEGLKEVSCECYEAVKMHYDALKSTVSNE